MDRSSARSGPIDLSSKAEFASALRPDTPRLAVAPSLPRGGHAHGGDAAARASTRRTLVALQCGHSCRVLIPQPTPYLMPAPATHTSAREPLPPWWRIPRPANALLDEAENRPLHALVTLRKCSTLYNFPTNSPSNTARAPAGGTYSVNPP